MNMRIWKCAGLVVFVAVMVCAIAYAEKPFDTAQGGHEAKDVTLPAAAKSAVMAAYPQGTIEKTNAERVSEVFELLVKQKDGQEFEPTVTPDGIITGVESKVGKDKLTDAAAKALSKEAQGAEIKSIDQEIKYFVIKPVKLDKPETTFEVKLSKDGNECEIRVAANGTVLEKSEWQKPKDNNAGKSEDNEEQDEQKVTIDQVPPAVKATMLSEAGKGTIKEIEQETRDGKTVYGADLIIDGNKFEIKVSSDGKLLDKKAEGKDDEDSSGAKGK